MSSRKYEICNNFPPDISVNCDFRVSPMVGWIHRKKMGREIVFFPKWEIDETPLIQEKPKKQLTKFKFRR